VRSAICVSVVAGAVLQQIMHAAEHPSVSGNVFDVAYTVMSTKCTSTTRVLLLVCHVTAAIVCRTAPAFQDPYHLSYCSTAHQSVPRVTQQQENTSQFPCFPFTPPTIDCNSSSTHTRQSACHTLQRISLACTARTAVALQRLRIAGSTTTIPHQHSAPTLHPFPSCFVPYL
jgi:hypothetical protein